MPNGKRTLVRPLLTEARGPASDGRIGVLAPRGTRRQTVRAECLTLDDSFMTQSQLAPSKRVHFCRLFQTMITTPRKLSFAYGLRFDCTRVQIQLFGDSDMTFASPRKCWHQGLFVAKTEASGEAGSMTKAIIKSAETDPAARPRRVNASDVAKVAGVSRSAVSRAFDPSAYLDPQKRELILQTAMQLGYRPNALAASLQGTRTNLVGVIIGDMGNQYDAEFAAHLLSRLNASNKWPLVVGGSQPVTEEAILSILRYPLDALIVRGGSLEPRLFDDCAKLNIPLIFSGRIVDASLADCVCCRNARGMAEAVHLLLRTGRKGFAYIGGPETWSSERERLAGVTGALAQNGVTLLGQHQADYTFEGGAAAAALLLDDERIDALVCANDAMALGALSYVRNQTGRRVPGDLAIVGFDDVSMASWPDFDLTTVRNPLGAMIDEVVRLLEARLADPFKPTETVMLDPILKERGTH